MRRRTYLEDKNSPVVDIVSKLVRSICSALRSTDTSSAIVYVEVGCNHGEVNIDDSGPRMSWKVQDKGTKVI